MNKYKSILFILIAVLSGGLILFLISGAAKNTHIETEKKTESPSFLSMIVSSAPVPDFVEFCGERIPLGRMDMRERFDRELNSLIYLHSNILLYFKRANRFFPVIDPILKKNDIPLDFKYLCVIESNLDTRAFSPAKAAGLWQFMDSTAKNYGLEITDEIDERYHIEKATEAACQYFKSAYQRYGKWTDVAASYNAGMGRISSAMQEQSVDSAFDLLLASETSRYVFRIMALKEIFENPEKYGIILKKENLYPLIPVHYIEVTSDIDNLASFAKENGINYMQLKEFNVWLRRPVLKVAKGKSYRIAIPEKEDLYYSPDKIKIYDDRWVNQ
ncbi:MAG: transglycosylase SLT domain-containing protein [Dysgonamonadaceae bacterium]|jgi:hypothetical protein|nr:transglycosylase SLT domain-containing protein [Dysgonamonadaceae bacterium]